jgi:TonB family protein
MTHGVTRPTIHGASRVRLARAALAFALLLTLLPASPAAFFVARAQEPRAQAPDEDFERGKRLLAQGDPKGAVAALKRVAERRKTDADAWYQLGLALGHQRKAKDARKAFETALKLRPDWTDARAGLAFTLLSLNKTADAEREATRVLDSDPRHASALYVVGVAHFAQERFSEALAEAEAALRADPNFTAAAMLAADAVLNAHIEESMRQGRQHPVPVGASSEERKAVLALREPALAPYRARMRELADRLEALAAARSSAPEAEDWREKAGTLRHYGRERGESVGGEIFSAGQLTKRAVITSKPEPGYTEEAKQQGVEGVVRLRAVLMPDGRVRHVVPLRRLPAGLTEKCVAAARKIRFEPALLNGNPVAQYVVLEYNFNIY